MEAKRTIRTPEEVQKQRVEYFIKELEEILVHDTMGNSIQCAIDNIGWLANKCVHLLMEKNGCQNDDGGRRRNC